MAAPDFPPDDPGAGVRIQETVSEAYGSGLAVARVFGNTILEPSWWPDDVEQVAYSLDGLVGPPGRLRYRIGSTRADGRPIFVVGFLEAAWAGRSPRDWLVGEWSEPPELAHVRGLIGRVGDPPSLLVVIYDQQLAIQMIGYHSDAEIMRAFRSLRPIVP